MARRRVLPATHSRHVARPRDICYILRSAFSLARICISRAKSPQSQSTITWSDFNQSRVCPNAAEWDLQIVKWWMDGIGARWKKGQTWICWGFKCSMLQTKSHQRNNSSYKYFNRLLLAEKKTWWHKNYLDSLQSATHIFCVSQMAWYRINVVE